jgi:hypothetical protein
VNALNVLLAAALWTFHGVLLMWSWGQYRPHIALLHGVGALLGVGLLIWIGLPVWVLTLAGALVGGAGAWGHRLAPGLWVGIGLLWLVPFWLHSGSALLLVGSFALTAQVVAALVVLARH